MKNRLPACFVAATYLSQSVMAQSWHTYHGDYALTGVSSQVRIPKSPSGSSLGLLRIPNSSAALCSNTYLLRPIPVILIQIPINSSSDQSRMDFSVGTNYVCPAPQKHDAPTPAKDLF